MLGVICYFSGSGNTKWVADKLSDELVAHGHQVHLYNLELGSKTPKLEKFDYLILGTPVHAEVSPPPVNDFIAELPVSQGQRCLIYSTQGAASAVTVNLLGKKLRDKGYRVQYEVTIRMPNNFYFGVGICPSQQKIARYLHQATAQIKQVAKEFVTGQERRNPAGRFRLAGAKLLELGYRRYLPLLATRLKGSDQCTSCGVCVKRCPTDNIRLAKEKLTFGNRCIMCTRCIHICPENAIRYGSKKIEQTQKDIIKCLR